MSYQPNKKTDLRVWKNLRYDFPAGVVVFLVALPLCLGIALASKGEVDEAPLFSGLLAGIIGGLVVPWLSRSPLSVSGPAAGLIAIVISGIDSAGSYDAFLVAVLIGGLIQLALGFFKAGTVAYFFPSAVIKGMLAAIGLILIRKQLPHAFGVDSEAVDLSFHALDTLAVIREIAVEGHFELGAIIISLISLALLITWEKTPLKRINVLPAALVVVVVGVLVNQLLGQIRPEWLLSGGLGGHLVQLPDSLVNDGFKGFLSELRFPDFSAFANPQIYGIGLTIGLVASVETLLSVEAVDKLDPHRRSTPLNQELLAQGAANTLAGLLGALPITAVIVRSSANVNAGGQTRASALIHGVLLLLSVVTIAGVLNLIPLASLAAILLVIGYTLARPELWRKMWRDGLDQFLPFATTVVSVLVFDLLVGIAIGTALGIFFIVRGNFRTAIKVDKQEQAYRIILHKDVSFLNKAILSETLNRVPEGANIVIDGSRADFIDHDIQEIIREFEIRAQESGIGFKVVGVRAEDAKV
jgi:MFS superfamily sulfate permease-like transporter